MRNRFLVVCLCVLAGSAFAQNSNWTDYCNAEGASHKLAGAALAAFMKKCEADVRSGRVQPTVHTPSPSTPSSVAPSSSTGGTACQRFPNLC